MNNNTKQQAAALTAAGIKICKYVVFAIRYTNSIIIGITYY